MFIEITPQLSQDIEGALDAALRHSGLAALQPVSRIVLAMNAARPSIDSPPEEETELNDVTGT